MKKIRIVLREVAQAQGYNISTLAVAAKLNAATIRKLWHDESKRIDLENLEKVAATLGVSPLDLLEVVEEE
jgi:DNA-binding Xre family transcriptional regulator